MRGFAPHYAGVVARSADLIILIGITDTVSLRTNDSRSVRRGALSKPRTVLHGPTRAETVASGPCQDPVRIERGALPGRKEVVPDVWTIEWAIPMSASEDTSHWRAYTRDVPVPQLGGDAGFTHIMYVRCRKCVACRREAARMWEQRANVEHTKVGRTWFGTWTISPKVVDAWQLADAEAIATRGLSDEKAAFALREATVARAQREFTLMFKKFRKMGADCRYLLVTEYHKSGAPHFHALIHTRVLTYRQLKSGWTHGFTNFKLVTDRAQLAYVSKYVRKFTNGRVRSSLRYGLVLPVLSIDDNRDNNDTQKPSPFGRGVRRRKKVY